MKTKIILFDVFGTTVDWRSSIAAEIADFGRSRGADADADAFALADRWRAGFRRLQSQIAGGERDWITMDAMHREVLDGLLPEMGGDGATEDEIAHLNHAWRRLNAWDDVVEGLTVLKRNRVIGALSNGNMSLLIGLSKYAGLPWDCVLSTGMFGGYKPNPRVYHGAARILDADPSEIMLAAAHAYDVDGARQAGMRTAYIRRPNEFGQGKAEDPGDTSRFDIVAGGFKELAERLGREG